MWYSRGILFKVQFLQERFETAAQAEEARKNLDIYSAGTEQLDRAVQQDFPGLLN